MHHLTAAINNNCHRHYTITPDIFTNTHHLQIIGSIFASYRTHVMNYFASLGINFYASGMQDAEVVKSLCRSVMTLLGFCKKKLF